MLPCALIFDYVCNTKPSHPTALMHTPHVPIPDVAFIKAAVVLWGCHGDQHDAKHRGQQ